MLKPKIHGYTEKGTEITECDLVRTHWYIRQSIEKV